MKSSRSDRGSGSEVEVDIAVEVSVVLVMVREVVVIRLLLVSVSGGEEKRRGEAKRETGISVPRFLAPGPGGLARHCSVTKPPHQHWSPVLVIAARQ